MMFVLKMTNSLNCKDIKSINPRNTVNYVGCTFCYGCFDPLSLKRDKHYGAGNRVIDTLEITD